MRLPTRPRHRATAAIATLLSASTLIQPALSNPFPKDALHDILKAGFLQDPLCASYCGVENEHCCSADEACTTAEGVAACAAVTVATQVEVAIATIYPRQDDTWSLYTSTYTITSTYTTTGSAWGGASTTVAGVSTATCTPQAIGETSCGDICCASDQTCAYAGQCTAAAGGGGVVTGTTTSWTTYPTTITTAGSTITTQFSAPYRVTGTGTTTSTGVIESATTTANGTAVAGGTGGSTLSGGAIAGIVIGALVGVLILLAICACCIMRGLWHGLLALLGIGSKKKDRRSSRDRETVIVEEERYSRHGSNSHAARNSHGGWFARNPARSAAGESRRTSEKATKTKDSNEASWWGAGALGTLLLLLGLRRDKKRRSTSSAAAARRRSSRPRSTVSSSYFSDSYTASSPSEFSSDYTYSSVYTPVQSSAPPARGREYSRGPSVVPSQHGRTQSVARSASRGAGGGVRQVYRDEYDPMTKPPPDYAGSASSGGRTRDTRRSRRTETTRVSRAPSRR